MAASKRELLRRGGVWAKASDTAYAMLWFEYLKISPSYALAHKHRTGTWTATDDARKPADFDAVISVYDDLGDVRSISFRDWWLATGIDYFGFQGAIPRIKHLGTLRQNAETQADDLIAEVKGYRDGSWPNQGKPTTMVLAIPVGMTKAQILKQVAAEIAKYPEAHRSFADTPPKYSLISRKLDNRSLFKYLMCVWTKARLPKAALWRIGVAAKVSSMYSGRLDASAKLATNQQIEDRNALKIYTSRAISRGLLIAENAARGAFPTYKPNKHAVSPDWADLLVAVNQRVKLDKNG